MSETSTTRAIGVTDPSAQAGDVPQTTWAELEEMIRADAGGIHEALRIRGEQMGLQPVPLRDEHNRRLLYSIAESDTTGSELGWQLAAHVSGHANGPLPHVARAEALLGHPPGMFEAMRTAQNDPRNVARGAARRTHHEIYETARIDRDLEDLRDVGHYSTNSGGVAARTPSGDYLIGLATEATLDALREAGYTETDPHNKMGVPLSNNQDRNKKIREALGERF